MPEPANCAVGVLAAIKVASTFSTSDVKLTSAAALWVMVIVAVDVPPMAIVPGEKPLLTDGSASLKI